MNKYNFGLLLILVFGRCSTETKTIRYKLYENDTRKNHVYTIQIPKGYKLFSWTGGHEEQHEYWYSDSSVIYLSRDLGVSTINNENIKNEEGAYAKRLQEFLANDTITLSGTDISGEYWKEIKLKNICLGYAGVAKEKVEIFESALHSLK